MFSMLFNNYRMLNVNKKKPLKMSERVLILITFNYIIHSDTSSSKIISSIEIINKEKRYDRFKKPLSR